MSDTVTALVLPPGVKTVRDLINAYLSEDRLEVIELTEEPNEVWVSDSDGDHLVTTLDYEGIIDTVSLRKFQHVYTTPWEGGGQ